MGDDGEGAEGIVECGDCGEVVEDVKVCLGGQVGGPMGVRGLSIKRGITPIYEG